MAARLRAPLCLVLALAGPLGGCLGQTHTPLLQSGGNTKTPVREVLRSTVTSESAVIETSHGILRVTAWRGDTFRLQLARDESVRPLGSFAVEGSSLPPVPMKVDESDTLILLRSEQAMLRIDKKPLRLRLLDASGEVIVDDVAGFWNDMNEPAVFVPSKTFPETLEHRLDDGSTRVHTLLHNVYGMLNARATYEGVRRLRPSQRPFILTRAAYAGAQKYAASWTGDNTADRAHLALTIPQLLSLGVSGYPFNGADVGGFIGCPSPALFAEWMELGALQPFFRNHSKQDACRREPWLFGAAIEARARRAVERRYRLLPYLYTVFEEASRTGLPIMRPVWLEYPNDSSGYRNDTVFLLGQDLLVAPQLQEGATSYRVTLPDDDWYDRQTLAPVKGGPLDLPVSADDSVRLFVRAGAIVPEAPVVQNLKRPLAAALSLEVWPGADCRGSLYHDDGETFAYQQGAFRRVTYACERTETALTVSARSTGAHPVWWNETHLVIRDVPRAPAKVQDSAGTALAHAFDAGHKTLKVTLPGAGADFEIRASW